ncbi:MAG: hypothetical protein PHD95_01460 [Candidatus ainarchaeum sp.]|nr:hypothetical protein [Candidatus ainarchaeum sp.]
MECYSPTKLGALAYAVVLTVAAVIVLAVARYLLAKPILTIDLAATAAIVFIIGFAVQWYMQARCCKSPSKTKAKE